MPLHLPEEEEQQGQQERDCSAEDSDWEADVGDPWGGGAAMED